MFSRTNNSGKSAATTDVGFGYGWVHSYAMNLVSNDFGACPNCTAAQAPQNFDGVTSSITYTDERGGQTSFLETPTTTSGVTTYSVTNPLSVFNTMTISTPSNGNQLVILAFRNGAQYLFNVTGGDIGVTPNLTARLTTIKNQWGDQLNINYDSSNRISTITDNQNISGRNGLTFNYKNGDNHITSINDWAGRTWAYTYSNSYLATYTNPTPIPSPNPNNYQNVTYYFYSNSPLITSTPSQLYYTNFSTGAGYGLLQYVIKPQLRNNYLVYTVFNYYQNGRVINYADGMSDTEILDYDLFRQNTRVTDPRNNVREYDYDTYGFMTKMIEPDGGILYFASQNDSLRACKTDALGYATLYSYNQNQSLYTYTNTNYTGCTVSSSNTATNSDTGGNVTLEQDALGNSVKTTYSSYYDQVASITDKNGNIVNTSFYTTTGTQSNKCDLAGKPNTVTIAALTVGGTTTNNVNLQTYCWNPNGALNNLQEFLDTAGKHIRTTSYTYDSTGLNVTDVKVTATNTTAVIHTQYTYDTLGRVLTSTLNRTTSITNSALEQLTTSYTYDALDRAVQVKNPEGRIQQTVYDGNGKIYQQIAWYPSTTARTGCNAPATINGASYVMCTEATYQYDAADRPSSVTDIYGNTATYVYDQSGNVISQTDANGHTSQFQYDPMNRVTAIIDANGRTSKAVYNERGDLTSATNPNNETLTSVYDALGRLTKATDNMGNVTTFSYDKNGNKTCVVDANNHTTSTTAGYQPLNSSGCTVSFTYDQLNRLTQVTDAQNHATAYTYNLLGQQLTVTDANSHATTMAYDDLGRMTTLTDPLANSASVVTDEAGNAIQLTDRKGQISQHFYDVMNRRTLSNFEADSSSDSFTFNQYDDLITVQNSNLSYSLIYDSKHRLTSKTDSRLGLSESWGYDPAGNIHNKTDYQGNVTTYQYDDSNRLTAETNPAYLEVSYHYDPAGRLLDRILSNGAKTSYTYDTGGRLSSLINTAAPNPNNTIVSAVINSTTYTRDAVGNILTALEAAGTSQAAGTSTFTYDPVYRLLTATYPTTANNETIAYDPVGNRTKYTKGSTTLYYNVNAANRYTTTNTTSATGPVYETYTYDKNGSLTNITGNRNLTLTWDAHNRASQIQVGAITPYSYQYDINSYRIAKNLNTIFNNYYLENGKLESIYDNNGNVQAKYMRGSVIDEVVYGYQNNSGAMTNYTYHHDALESVLGQSGNTGTVVAAQGYTSFGSTVNATGTSNNTLKFTGREQDSETGLYYYRARYYDPLTGRFISEDPIRSGINWYTYANNNPVNSNDPSGECGPCISAALRAIGSFGTIYGATTGGLAGYVSGGTTQSAVVGAGIGGVTGYFGPLLAGGIASGGYWSALVSTWTLPTIGGVSAIGGTMAGNASTGNNLWNGTGTSGLIGFASPFASGEAFLSLGTVSPTIANGFSTVTGFYNLMGTYLDPNSTYGYKASNKSASTQNTSKTTQQSSSSSNSSAVSQAVNAAFAAQINSAMDSVNSIINTPAPAAPPISMPSSGTTYPLPPEPDFNGEYISAADGGFIIYPNMSNTSQIQRVYSKH